MSKTETGDGPRKIVVVGHGMVAHRFCEVLMQKGGPGAFDITVLGNEGQLAYDRVHLGDVLEPGGASTPLATQSFYDDHGIALHLDEEVTTIDRGKRVVRTVRDREIEYRTLVLATGARARVPSVEGLSSEDVLTYRTVRDVARIRAATSSKHRVAIVGGGLLGIECADALRRAGLTVHVLEASKSLLPRQLDADSAAVLKQSIEERGVLVETGYRLLRVARDERDRFVLFGESTGSLDVDVLIFASGVLPEDTLARAAGLLCAPSGGVSVNDQLLTSDPSIFAIGDCAAHRGITPGLVAPGYEMAEVLAAHLVGDESAAFSGVSRQCQLKVAGTDVAALGRYDMEAPHYNFTDGKTARCLVVEGNRLVGATLVGAAPERFAIARAIERGRSLSRAELRRFTKTGQLGLGSRLPLAEWSASAMVCQCSRVTRGELSTAVANGACDIEALTMATRAGAVCGSCRPLLGELVGAEVVDTSSPYPRLTGMASLAVLLAALLFLFLPPIPVEQSVTDAVADVGALWRTAWFRQLTGFVLTFLFAVGLLLSARKRLSWFRWGSFGGYRALHTALGLLSVMLLAVHTGLRFGANLNFALMCVFVGSAVAGGATGIVTYFESSLKSERARAVRGRLARVHLWLLWPLPALLGFHVLAAYYF